MNMHVEILNNLKNTIETYLESYDFEYKSSNKLKVYMFGKYNGNSEKHYVYVIMNLQNCKLYVGQTRNIKLRLEQHKSAKDYKTSYFHKEILKFGIERFKTIFLIEIRSKKEYYAIDLGISLEKFLQDKMESNIPGKGYNVNHPVTSVDRYLDERSSRREDLKYIKWMYPIIPNVPENNIDQILLNKRFRIKNSQSKGNNNRMIRNEVISFLKSTKDDDRLKSWYKILYTHEDGECKTRCHLSVFRKLKPIINHFIDRNNNDISLYLINGFISLAIDEFDSVYSREELKYAIKKIASLGEELRKGMLISILKTAVDFLTIGQCNQLSKFLISNGFNLMDDLKQIHLHLDDQFSYGSMIKTLHSKIREHSYGGYPWET
jgi:hypothetical protein